MAKKFATPVTYTEDDQKAESDRINKLIRSGGPGSVTVVDKGKKKDQSMSNFIRRGAGRNVASTPEEAERLAKTDGLTDEDFQDVSPKLIATLEKMDDETLAEMLIEAQKSDPHRKPGRPRNPRGHAGAGTGGQYPRSGSRSVSEVIRFIVRERRRRERGGR